MTNRPLTATELADARDAYTRLGKVRWLGDTYHLNMLLPQIDDAIRNRTTDGKPLRTERVPTAADIGRRVKVRESSNLGWICCRCFAGFDSDGKFVAELPTGQLSRWSYAIIDEEATQ